jgi:hypothetical protein
MSRIRVQKIASAVHRLGFKREIEITEDMEPRAGNVVLVRALSEKRVYNELELENGRMSRISRGDIIVGALGRRRALQGFVGEVPKAIRAGDTLQLLNMGGVVGRSRSFHKDLGQPSVVEVLGMAVRDGRIVNLKDAALPEVSTLAGRDIPPVVMVSGSCMNSGKTFVCSQLIQDLSKQGKAVHGGKLSGVACRRDTVSMEDHGALRTSSFIDVGYSSTAGLPPDEMVAIARTVIAFLAEGDPDVIFLELGDGIIGDYGVMPMLEDPELASHRKLHIFCAGDLVSSWGGHRFLADRGVGIDLFSGPTTDSSVGVEYIEGSLGVTAINARLNPERLGEEVARRLGLYVERPGIPAEPPASGNGQGTINGNLSPAEAPSGADRAGEAAKT